MTTKKSAKPTRKRTLKRKTRSTLLTGTDPILALVTRSIQEFYHNDASCPSIVISWLPGLRQYYIGLQRYRQSWGKDPYSVFNVKDADLITALNLFTETWKNRIEPRKDATEALLRS